MSEKITENLDGDRSFQDRVFARFDALEVYLKNIDSRVQNLDSRVQSLDSRVQSLDSRVQSLDSRVQNLDSRVESLDARVQSLDSRVQNLDARVQNLDARVQVLESRAYDTKPIWENALKEIVETRRELTRRLDRIEAMVLDTRAGLSEAEDRLNKLESRPS
jgi:chromosome segregation ATPase